LPRPRGVCPRVSSHFEQRFSAHVQSLFEGERLGGVLPAARAALLAALTAPEQSPTVVIVPRQADAEALVEDIQAFGVPALLFPEIEMTMFDEGVTDGQRLEVLYELGRGGARVVVTSLLGFLQPTAAPGKIPVHSLKTGALERDVFVQSLEELGYGRCRRVTSRGEFCVQGNVVDVFPSNGAPARLEFRAGELLAIRAFDCSTQLSTGAEVEELQVLPMTEAKRKASFVQHVPESSRICLVEPEQLKQRLASMAAAAAAEWKYSTYEQIALLHNDESDDWGEVLQLCGQRPRLVLESSAGKLSVEPLPLWGTLGGFATWAGQQEDPVLVISARAARVRSSLTRRGIENVEVREGTLNAGFACAGVGAVCSDRELFGAALRPDATQSVLEEATLFEEGDLVVHRDRGIGRFEGLVPVEITGTRRDLLKLTYAKDQTLMVPPDQIERLTPYRGGEEEAPALSRLDTAAWQKQLSKVEAAAQAIAAELLRQRQRRNARKAQPMAPDSPEQEEMEAAFPHAETPSQLQAVKDIKADLERERAMDRLLCGDVGYGKTEVAIRAAFKVAASGFQVAVLVPTTVLAQQHLGKFQERVRGVAVAGLWSDLEDTEEVLAGLKDGSISIVVGTHSLLADSVEFAKLGLLIVDEEQQFGVNHKERLKAMSETVHMLSMTATPIPRTMQLSLAGIRDISLLDAPPERRRPVRTYLLQESPKLLLGALMRELEREGQAFVLHNRVADLEPLAKRLSRSLGPRVHVAVAHGQMSGEQLSSTFERFSRGEIHVLVCSTIIESGVDFPNVNTIVIKDAHRFGLAQLYQIRGRVGRAGRQAFCYLLTPEENTLSDKARQRLEVIKRFTELGSGFQISLRDLEIRGAGDLLGGSQSGHIARIGYLLYAQMLSASLQADEQAADAPASVSVELPLQAYLPTEYVAQTRSRIEIYRRLALLRNKNQCDKLQDELADRFGALPEPVRNLLALARLRIVAGERGVARIRYEEQFGEAQVLCDDAKLTGVPRGPGLLDWVVRKLAQDVPVPA
jgi:transcription-repair coupling factor (superfamily II helicase)